MEEGFGGMISEFLHKIPRSNQNSATLMELARPEAGTEEIGILVGCALFLQRLGLVQVILREPLRESQIRASAQLPKYVLNSLASYFQEDIQLVADWERVGIQASKSQGYSDVLENGVQFMRILDLRRLRTMADPVPSRTLQVAQILIKRMNPASGHSEFLFQFDGKAHQYQLIGGRYRDSDKDAKWTAIRELHEELWNSQDLDYDSYQLRKIHEVSLIDISPTFGALTNYHFTVFHLVNLRPGVLHTSPMDRWLTIGEMLSGYIIDGGSRVTVANSDLYQQIDQHLNGGLALLENSEDSATEISVAEGRLRLLERRLRTLKRRQNNSIGDMDISKQIAELQEIIKSEKKL